MNYRITACSSILALLLLASACRSESEQDRAVTPLITPDFILTTAPDSAIEISDDIPWQHIDPFPMKLMEPPEPLPPFSEVSSERH